MNSKFSLLNLLCLVVFFLLLGCNRNEDPVLNTATEELTIRILNDETAPCQRCPKLQTFSFSYFDETRSNINGGHFLLDFNIENDNTQYGAIPVRIDLFDYMQETNDFKHLNEDPFFKTFLDLLEVPEDTLIRLHPLTEYSNDVSQKIMDGFYDDVNAFCTDNHDEELYAATEVSFRRSADGNLVAPNSASICKLASDICAMRSIADLMTFSLYPYEIIDQSREDKYNKNNFIYTDPFAELKFDNRNLVADVDFDDIEGVETDLKLGECPIFRSNDRTVPVEFEMDYSMESGQLQLKAEWEDGRPLHRANIILAVDEFALTNIRVVREIADNNGFANGATMNLPELKNILEEEGNVAVFLQIASQESNDIDDTINSVIFEITEGTCEEFE